MKNKDKEPTRRSTRKRQKECSPADPGRKNTSAPAAKAIVAEPSPKIQRTVEHRKVDSYCWICHRVGQEVMCSHCPRVYHRDCLNSSHMRFSPSWRCEECQMQSLVEGIKPQNIEMEMMKQLLKFAVAEATNYEVTKNNLKTPTSAFKYFQVWPLDNSDSLYQIMDLHILSDKVNSKDVFPYMTCAAFFSDVKWISHNCHIFHGVASEITELAMKLEENFKRELLDIEGCHECYYTKHIEEGHPNFFTKVCEDPHEVIWAKLKGSHYWPAKLLRIYNDHADIRFFRTHDKALIPVSHCLRISKRSPNQKGNKQKNFQDAIRELSVYVSTYEALYGSLTYYAPRTALSHDDASNKPAKRGQYRQTISESVNESDSQIYKSVGIQLEKNSHMSSSEFLENDSCRLNVASIEDRFEVCMEFVTEDMLCPQNDPSRLLDTSIPISLPDSFPSTHLLNSPNDDASDYAHSRDLSLEGSCRQINAVPFINTNTSNELPVITSAKSQEPKNLKVSSTNESTEVDIEQLNDDIIQKLGKLAVDHVNTRSRLSDSAIKDILNPGNAVGDLGEKTVEAHGGKEIKADLRQLYGYCRYIASTKPYLRDVLNKCLNFGISSFIQLWSTSHTQKRDDTAANAFMNLCQQIRDERDEMNKDKEFHKQNSEILRTENDQLKQEALTANQKFNAEIRFQDIMRKRIQLLCHKAARSMKDHKSFPEVRANCKSLEADVSKLQNNIQLLLEGLQQKRAQCTEQNEEIIQLKNQQQHQEETISQLTEQFKMQCQFIGELKKQLESRQNHRTNVAVQTDSPGNNMLTLQKLPVFCAAKETRSENQKMLPESVLESGLRVRNQRAIILHPAGPSFMQSRKINSKAKKKRSFPKKNQ